LSGDIAHAEGHFTTGDALFNTLRNNPLAPYVTRVVQFGSEPLFDQVLPIGTLTSEVTKAKSILSSLGIPVTISEMAYGKFRLTHPYFLRCLLTPHCRLPIHGELAAASQCGGLD
jgi:hypothetical protein